MGYELRHRDGAYGQAKGSPRAVRASVRAWLRPTLFRAIADGLWSVLVMFATVATVSSSSRKAPVTIRHASDNSAAMLMIGWAWGGVSMTISSAPLPLSSSIWLAMVRPPRATICGALCSGVCPTLDGSLRVAQLPQPCGLGPATAERTKSSGPPLARMLKYASPWFARNPGIAIRAFVHAACHMLSQDIFEGPAGRSGEGERRMDERRQAGRGC